MGFNTDGRFVAAGGNTILDAGGLTNTDNGIAALYMNENTVLDANIFQIQIF